MPALGRSLQAKLRRLLCEQGQFPTTKHLKAHRALDCIAAAQEHAHAHGVSKHLETTAPLHSCTLKMKGNSTDKVGSRNRKHANTDVKTPMQHKDPIRQDRNKNCCLTYNRCGIMHRGRDSDRGGSAGGGRGRGGGGGATVQLLFSCGSHHPNHMPPAAAAARASPLAC